MQTQYQLRYAQNEVTGEKAYCPGKTRHSQAPCGQHSLRWIRFSVSIQTESYSLGAQPQFSRLKKIHIEKSHTEYFHYTQNQSNALLKYITYFTNTQHYIEMHGNPTHAGNIGLTESEGMRCRNAVLNIYY